jgi:hypothetical protein
MKGLLVEVMGTDCTNEGVTSGVTEAILAGEGIPEIFEAKAGRPLLILGEGYKGRLMAVPAGQPVGMIGPMFGGHFVYTSDSRFPSGQPIHVHDRFETPKQYEELSI